jgi:hypothetical protein
MGCANLSLLEIKGVRVNLIDLQLKIHEQNKAKGWWDNHRSFSKLTNLNISEVSEAVEADRRNLFDSKLTKYKGVPVEAADGCIRSFDVLASLGNESYEASKMAIAIIENNPDDIDYLLAFSSWCFSMAWEFHELKNAPSAAKQYLVDAVNALFVVIMKYGHNPVDLMLEKMEFNESRPDHLPENRQGKVGQKAY